MSSQLLNHIFLTGFMGSGKSTIGKRLAQKLDVGFIDTDEQIESQVGMGISRIFAAKGEEWFRKIEEETVLSVLSQPDRNIISLGGGSLLSTLTVNNIIEDGMLIYIKSDPVEIWKRIKHSTRRPLLRNEGEEWSKERYLERMNILMGEREEGYLKAHIVIDRDGKEVDEIVEQILLELNTDI
jgi:shikimate kinase